MQTAHLKGFTQIIDIGGQIMSTSSSTTSIHARLGAEESIVLHMHMHVMQVLPWFTLGNKVQTSLAGVQGTAVYTEHVIYERLVAHVHKVAS